ncbi:hypothetical protein GQ55_9G490600 [Panicum hallii var. hallii]|uniref:GOLD domain-containing protein n=1 Tax=Panicum hallii var. hallii TaxID=1504633 RepID=A0A2T7CD35_9POAL|nr:hypothetical protein GQ55_9G490600 [Panicum hallii var. hallii]
MTTPPLLLAVILHVCAAAVEALVFDVPSGSSKCLTEELRRGALSRTSYLVAPESTSAADPRVSARVTGPRGEELHLAEAAERGELRFQAAEDGEHTACFWTPRYERGAVVSVDVQWDTTGASARGTPPAVADGRIAEEQASVTFQSIAEELKKLEDSARLIHEEMISLRQSEREMQRLNQDTATRMHAFTLMSLAMCVGVAGLQLWHLKTFFQKQHIL